MIANLFLIIIVGLLVSILLEAMNQKQLAKLTVLLMVLMVINVAAPKINEVYNKWLDTGRKVENLTEKIKQLEKNDSKLEEPEFKKKLDEFENAPWANWGTPKE